MNDQTESLGERFAVIEGRWNRRDDEDGEVMGFLREVLGSLESIRAAAWDEGWDRGNDYALRTPTQNADARWSNPHRNA